MLKLLLTSPYLVKGKLYPFEEVLADFWDWIILLIAVIFVIKISQYVSSNVFLTVYQLYWGTIDAQKITYI